MSARVFLDKPHAHFTNLDFITGRVVLSLPVETAVTLVVVKLEGESRTRLVAPKHPHNERSDKKRTEIESHKLLYKTVTLFPTPEMRPLVAPKWNAYIPVTTQFPFNNDCINNVLASNLNMAGIRLEVARDTNRHLKKTLPPSLFGFPGEAEIRYFVKVTVVRPQFYKENYRGFADFKFLPIEPPRTKEADKETFARRQHQFSRFPNIQEEKGFFRKTSVKSQDTSTPPKFSVDARLPSPAIITCNEPLPLRVLVKKLEEFSETLYLQLFQIELIGYTHLRAHDLSRKQSSSWVITSRSNLNVPLGSADNPVGKEWKIDSRMWNQIPLPNSVAPSFDTCNISRSYELEVRVGISRGLNGSIKSDLVVLPLRIAVQVYSGVAPPPALLEAMGMPSELPGVSTHSRPPQPPRPSAPPYTSPPPAENYEDAPPSYEDAMAESLGPVDGPRREYNPLDASVSGNVAQTGADAQGSSVRNFKDGDRLFPSSSAVNTSTDSVNACDQPTLTDGPADPRFPRTESANTVHRSDTNAPKPVISGNQAPSPQPETNTLWPERRVTPGLGIPSRKPVPGSKHSTPSMERFSG